MWKEIITEEQIYHAELESIDDSWHANVQLSSVGFVELASRMCRNGIRVNAADIMRNASSRALL